MVDSSKSGAMHFEQEQLVQEVRDYGIQNFKNSLKEIQESLRDRERQYKAYSEICNNSKFEPSEREFAKSQLPALEEEIKLIKYNIKELNNKIRKLGKKNHTDDRQQLKMRILNNIRFLAKKNNIYLGELEKRAGCTPGYMSRLEKSDSAMPSVEFLLKCAESFGINVDVLVYKNIDEISPTDMFLIKFVTELERRTRKQRIHWERFDPKCTTKDNPFVLPDFDHSPTKNSTRVMAKSFTSLFFDDAKYSETEDGLWAILPDDDSKIFLLPVTKSMNGDLRTVWEIYLIYADGRIKPLLNTHECGIALAEAVISLYNISCASVKDIHIDDETKRVIDRFMSFGGGGE